MKRYIRVLIILLLLVVSLSLISVSQAQDLGDLQITPEAIGRNSWWIAFGLILFRQWWMVRQEKQKAQIEKQRTQATTQAVVQQEKAKEQASVIDAVREALELSNTSLGKKEDEIDKVRTERDTLSGKLADTEKRIQDLERQLNKYQVLAKRVPALQKEVKKLRNQRDEYMKRLERCNEKLVALQAKYKLYEMTQYNLPTQPIPHLDEDGNIIQPKLKNSADDGTENDSDKRNIA